MPEKNQKKSKNSSKEPQFQEGFLEISKEIPGVEKMFKAGVHFGHKTSKWSPKMKPFIFSAHNSIHIIDLEKTKEFLKKAVDFLKETVSQGGKILFVGTKPSSKAIIEQAAKMCQMPYVSGRWLGGTLTNYQTIKKRLDYLKELEQKKGSDKFKKYTKKERLMLEKKASKMRRQFGGLTEMLELPKALFVIDIKDNAIAVREAIRKNIPMVGVVDTNADPDLIEYPIPANDDAISALRLILGTVVGAIKEAQEKQVKNANPRKLQITKGVI